jgi:hypothetical protein
VDCTAQCQLFNCTRRCQTHITAAILCLYVLLSGKPYASLQLLAVWSHPYTLGWRISVLLTARVLAVRHKAHNNGPFTRNFTDRPKVNVTKPFKFRIPCEQPTKEMQYSWLIPKLRGQHEVQFAIGCRGSSRTPANLESKVTKEFSVLTNENSTLLFK